MEAIDKELLNEITVGNYPRKIDEYLAMGKPVVATRTETMGFFKDFTYLAADGKEFIDLIKRAVLENSIDLYRGRQNFALQHTWENSVAKIYQAINSIKQ